MIVDNKDELIITNLDFPEVVADTANMSHDEWLRARHQGIGGSDAAAILGVSPWTSRYSLWKDKISADPFVSEQTAAMAFGHKMEPIIANAYAEQTGMTIVDDTNLYAHPEHKFMLANLDRLILENGKPTAILEIKTSSRPQSWEDGVPAYYISQVQHYMAVTDMPHSFVTVLLNGEEMRTFDVPRDDSYIERLIEQEASFWNTVQKLLEPDVDGSESTFQTIRKGYDVSQGKSVELNQTVEELITRRVEAKKMIEQYTEETRLIESEIMLQLQDAEVGTLDGKTIVTWKEQHRNSIDAKLLKELYPEIADQVTTSSKFRVLRIK